MSIRIADEAPDFTAETTQGTISFHEWLGDSWGVLFSHPRDFTPVCTTELGTVAKLKPDFDKRNTKVIALSVDPIDDHTTWSSDIEETQGVAPNFPLIADPDKKIKLNLTYPASTGRNFQEILRVIDSLQLTAKHKVATGADWKQGEDVIITPAVSDDEAKERFPGYTTVKPYLRYTKAPVG